MISFLEELKKLSGQSLYTLSRRRPFRVLSVDAYEVEVYVQSTGRKRRISVTEIEPAWRTLYNRGELTRKEIEKRWSPRNQPYVAALLASFPRVTYVSKPIIRLRYKDSP